MNKVKAICLAGVVAFLLPTISLAAESQKVAKDVKFSFDGAFGTF